MQTRRANATNRIAPHGPDARSVEAKPALNDGESVREQWVRDRLLITASELSHAWLCSCQELEQSCRLNELYGVQVGAERYYPAVFASLPADQVHRVNRALKGDDDVGKFIFWHRAHGGLGARDLGHALRDGMIDRVVEVSLGWSEERGFF